MSESERDRSSRTPGWDDVSGSDWSEGDAGGEAGVGFSLGEVMCSMTDLHSAASLECLRQVAFLMILSREGIRTRVKRESASEEAIPGARGST